MIRIPEPHMVETLKDHTLVVVEDTPKVKIFRLKAPKYSRLQGCLIIFTEEGIVINGDLTPGRRGVISDLGYGLSWFGSDKSGSYLCEKFLEKEFRPDLAIRQFKEHLIYRRREGGLTRKRAREIWNEAEDIVEYNEDTQRQLYDLYSDTFHDSPEGWYGYNLGDAGWLVAIQQKFVELYQALKQQETAIAQHAQAAS